MNLLEHPISMSVVNVNAIEEGRKLMTRRPVHGGFDPNPYPIVNLVSYAEPVLGTQAYFSDPVSGEKFGIRCPFGNLGDLLWVQEPWCNLQDEGFQLDKPVYFFRADGEVINYKFQEDDKLQPLNAKWRSPVTMRKSLARTWLRITYIGVERLQSISEEDAKKEGVIYSAHPDSPYGNGYVNQFRVLWESIYGKRSWLANEWVWVVGFEKYEKKAT